MLHTELELLKPAIEQKARAALAAMRADDTLKALGVTDIAVIETLRDVATQMAYYSRGRMPNAVDVQEMYKAAGLWKITPAESHKMVTWTMNSKHLEGKAIDIAPMKGSRVWWDAPKDVWERMGQLGEQAGLNWGGRWKNADTPHFEAI
ncbi:MAG: cell wall biosynthesis protein [Alphaproteobacteria bacterium]|nr:cell wall biosynthesis protein [Alphaproteobacteria bacterium]